MRGVMRLSVLLVGLLAMTFGAGATELLGLRFGPDGDKTRIVFDLVGAPRFQLTGDTQGEGRLIFTFSDMSTGPTGINGFKGKGLVATYAYIPDGPRQTRFILTLKRTAKIADLFTLEPKGAVKKHRLVIDLAAADKAAFLASLPVNRRVEPPSGPGTTSITSALPASKQLSKQASKQAPSKSAPDSQTGAQSGPQEDRLGAFLASDAVTGVEKEPNAPPQQRDQTSTQKSARQPVLTNRAVDARPKASAPAASAARFGGTRLTAFDAPRLKPIARRDDPQTAARLGRMATPAARSQPSRLPSTALPKRRKAKRGKKAKPQELITIVLDPGHGGSHPGAIGLGGTYEKTVNLQAAKILSKLLTDTGRYRVLLTRSDDTKVELDQRADIAHANNAKLFLSIHADGNDNRSLRGSSVYTLSDEGKKRSVAEARERDDYQIADASMSEFSPVLGNILFDVTQKEFDRESRIFADLLLARLKGVTPLIKNAKRSEDLKVLLRPDLPAVLLEMAFISNREDEANLINPKWQRRTMKAVARAIDDYFEQSALTATARTVAPQGAAVSGSFQ
ncbi:MAG: N-acetylmuramoyl-L-alanine amidase [Pseudomonadota bacterium]